MHEQTMSADTINKLLPSIRFYVFTTLTPCISVVKSLKGNFVLAAEAIERRKSFLFDFEKLTTAMRMFHTVLFYAKKLLDVRQSISQHCRYFSVRILTFMAK